MKDKLQAHTYLRNPQAIYLRNMWVLNIVFSEDRTCPLGPGELVNYLEAVCKIECIGGTCWTKRLESTERASPFLLLETLPSPVGTLKTPPYKNA
jgi:hypothetical protein